MSKTRYGLILSSVCCLISASVGTLLAVRAHLPANFAGLLHGYNVVDDFLTWRGTALSAPFSLLFIQLVLTIGVLSGGSHHPGSVLHHWSVGRTHRRTGLQCPHL